MLTVICADKGSPGVTSVALALGASWPRPAVVVEADEAGGDLAIRLRTSAGTVLAETPTVATLAADARAQDRSPAMVRQHAQTVSQALAVVPGYLNAEQGAGIATLWEDLAIVLASADVDVIADIGRIHTGSSTMRLAELADIVVVVARANATSILHLRGRIRHLVSALTRNRRQPPVIAPMLVTNQHHAHAEMGEVGEILRAAALPTAEPMFVAWDPRALAQLENGDDRIKRTILIRSAKTAAERLVGLLPGTAPDGAEAIR